MLNLLEIQAGSQIEYIGDSLSYGGVYSVVTAESTYQNPTDCPDNNKGKLMIIEFMNNGTPMFFTLDRLNPKEWKVVS